MSEFELATRDWQKLLTPSQQEKYASAIRNGYFSDYHGTSWRHDTFYGAYIWKYPGRVKVVNRFRDMLGHKPAWNDITDDNMRDFKELLDESYSPNSVRTICAEIKSVLRSNKKTKPIVSEDFGYIMKQKNVPSQAVYLTMREIRKIRDYQPLTRIERYVKRMFMIESLTGARVGDCKRMSVDNVSENGNTLTYVSRKSHTEVTVPVHRWLKPFLVMSDPMEPKDLCQSTYNRSLQRICRACGITERVKVYSHGKENVGPKYQFVSSHTGRRSFATNLSMSGISIEQIALLMGHTNGNVPNIQMTQRYIVGKTSIDDKVYALFGTYRKNEPVYEWNDM